MSILFPKQIRRLSFVLRLGIFALIPLLTKFVFGLIWGVPEDFPDGPVFEFLMWLVALLLTVYAIAFIIVPRLRDVGISPWLGLLSVLPPINVLLLIYLAFASTGRNARHYWEDLRNERPVA